MLRTLDTALRFDPVAGANRCAKPHMIQSRVDGQLSAVHGLAAVRIMADRSPLFSLHLIQQEHCIPMGQDFHDFFSVHTITS